MHVYKLVYLLFWNTQGRQIAARLLRKVMRPLILVLCENRAHFISLAEMSNACNLRNNPWDGFYETWQRLTKEILRKKWQFLVSLETEGRGWNGKILTNCSMPLCLFMHVLYRYHSTAAPPPKSTAPTGCPSCWPEVAPANPVTVPFQWDLLGVFKRQSSQAWHDLSTDIWNLNLELFVRDGAWIWTLIDYEWI